MAIRRIKGDTAIEDGDYIRIERRSRRGVSLIVGVLLGVFICLYIFDGLAGIVPNKEQGFLILLVSAVVGFFFDDGKIVRRVPKIDLVEIKKYTWPSRVTVVFDDERSMRRR